jgi:glutaredoxin 3
VGERVELYGTAGCPYTAELREHLLWEGIDFVEYDVERDGEALRRMLALTGGRRTVPVRVDDGRVTQVGWQGRACIVAAPEGEAPGEPRPPTDAAGRAGR